MKRFVRNCFTGSFVFLLALLTITITGFSAAEATSNTSLQQGDNWRWEQLFDLSDPWEEDYEGLLDLITTWGDIPAPSTPTQAPPTHTPTPTSTEEVSFTPTQTETVTPTPTDTEEPTSAINIQDFFPLNQGDTWYYVDIPPKVGDTDAFRWTVVGSVGVDGYPDAASVRTEADEETDDRHMDEDYWIHDTNGDLLYAGLYKASGGGEFPEGEYFLDTPIRAGGNDIQVPSTIESDTTVTVGFLTADVHATVEYSELLPTFDTPLGTFTDVLVMTISLTADVPFAGTVDLLNNAFYLKEGVGMVGQRQNADENDAQFQKIQEGTVNGAPVVAK